MADDRAALKVEQKMRRPKIAIPEIGQNVRNYTKAVSAAFMEPVVISMQEANIEKSVQQEYLEYRNFNIENYDGLLLPGGVDIDPSRYGQENRGSVGIVPLLDELQFAMLDDFVRRGKPVLGICRGQQLINVYFGGTLIQDLPTGFRHRSVRPGLDRVHGCRTEEGSWLHDIYGASFMHNSAHHQACDVPGKGIIVDGRCDEDGVTEAIHHGSLPVFGVQFHPERMCLEHAREDTVDGLEIFLFFAGICKHSVNRDRAAVGNDLTGEGMGI